MTIFCQVNTINTSSSTIKDVFNPLTGTNEKIIYSHENNEDKNSLKVQLFSANCNTDFWTIKSDGEIQQWSLINDSVIGGDTILAGGGTSLAYCGIESPTFYCVQYPFYGITYYDSINGWLNIQTAVNRIINNGGHKGDQYFMGNVDGNNTILYYFDGTNLNTIDSLISETFVVADIAVDTLGRAWLFTGVNETSMTHLNVYNSTGLITSYTISYNSNHNYGSFFLNDTLYVGMGEHNPVHKNSIVPIIIDGDEASLGTPISFPDVGYYDMASCQHVQTPVSIGLELDNKFISKLRVNPNPFQTSTTISYELQQSSTLQITIFNHLGKQVSFIQQNQSEGKQQISWDATGQPSGIYYFRLQAGEQVAIGKLLLVR